MENGVNYYDTAFIYHDGKSEEFLGKALKKYDRNSFYVADKFNLQALPDYRKQFEIQLEKLQMDRIDFYLLHGVQDQSLEDFLQSGCIEYFDSLKKQGKIRYFGFSFHGKPESLQRMVDSYDFDFVQIQLNYYDYYHNTAKEQVELLHSRNIPVMVMEPVHGGMLANLNEECGSLLKNFGPYSYASWALRFVYQLDVQVILSGMSSMDQVKDNIQTFREIQPLTEEQQNAIRKISDLLYQEVGVPCTGCRYCVAHCPKSLSIPSLLQLYNEYKVGGEWRLARLKAYDPAPSACIECGKCTRHCPQSIEVRKYMKEMAKFEE
jgi:predicted aldo/keto reductase-like oxidoreductase